MEYDQNDHDDEMETISRKYSTLPPKKHSQKSDEEYPSRSTRRRYQYRQSAYLCI